MSYNRYDETQSETTPFTAGADKENTVGGDIEYKFSELFDLAELQRIQDAFAAATGVASIITEPDGTPITKPSNFCRFCIDIVRKTEKGSKNCMLSDSIIGSPKKDGPRIQTCLSGGLIDAGASIMVGEKHVANWLIGQILDSEYDVDDMLSYADEIGADRDAVKNALGMITRMPREQFSKICDFLFLTAQQLSKLAIENVVQAREIDRRKIAEREIKKLNENLEKIVQERTERLEETNAELEETNAALEEEVAERLNAEQRVKDINSQLESKITERTHLLEEINAELEETNAALEEEISERIKIDEALKEDILARKAAEMALKESYSILRTTFDSIDDGILVVNNKGDVIAYNQRFQEMWSIPDSLITTKNDRLLIEFVQNQLKNPYEFLNGVESVYSNQEAHIKDILEFADGRFFERSSQPQKIDNDIFGRIWCFTDIAERIRSEETLRKARDDAENANRAKSQFLANMSHEIRTPMNGVIGMTDLALMTESGEKQKEFLHVVKSSAKSLLRVLNDILDYSKIEAGKMNLEKAQFDIRNTIQDVIDLFDITAKQKGLYVRLSVDESIPKNLIGDSVRLRQVLSNLFGNAIKFTFEGGITLKVDCESIAGNIMNLKFLVSDTGIGISEENLKMLFERFSQIDNSNTRQFGGTGLGLAISKKLVEMMSGDIGVESRVNMGSNFFFTASFMLDDEKPAAGEAADQDLLHKKRLGNKKVLLVEDDEVSRTVAVLFLSKKGYDTTVAENGKNAIDLFEKNNFDLILMDINMPYLDGYTTTAVIRLKEQNTGVHTPIIAMTAYALSGDKEKCLNSGMDDYISKPIDVNELFAILDKWIE